MAGGEQKLQTKILKWLNANGFWCFKTVVCSKSGIMDIVGCTPTGKFFGIEVKYGSNKPSELQKYHVREVLARDGLAIVAWDLETVIEYLKDEIVEVTKQEDDRECLL